jgi:hypothetical protein
MIFLLPLGDAQWLESMEGDRCGCERVAQAGRGGARVRHWP